LFVNGLTTFNNDVSFNAEIFVGSDASFNSKLFVRGDVSMNSKLSVLSDVSFTNNLFVGGSIVNTGLTNSLAAKAPLAAPSFTGTVVSAGDVSLNSRLFVNGFTTFNNDLSLNMEIFVGSDASLNSKLFVRGDVSLNSRLSVLSDVSFTSNLFVGGSIVNTGLTNSLAAKANLAAPSFTGLVISAGDVSMNSRLSVLSDVSFSSKLFVGSGISSQSLEPLSLTTNLNIGANQTHGTLNIGTNNSRSGDINIGTGINSITSGAIAPIISIGNNPSTSNVTSISIGVNEDSYTLINTLIDLHLIPDFITIDIAHGHSIKMKNMVKFLRDRLPNTFIIGGNVCTPKAVTDLEKWGCDSVKIGIAGGSACTTYHSTGFGNRGWQANMIKDCCKVAKKPIIADGSIKENSDIVKSLVLGATMVMVGGMLAGYLDSPGEKVKNLIDGKWYKEFWGSASSHQSGKTNRIEGVKLNIPFKDESIFIKLKNIEESLQSAISYAGGDTPTLDSFLSVDYVVIK
jgi:GMP reductase